MDAASARIMDKQLLEGTLPGADPLRLWDSYGTGLLCDGCDVAITRSEKEQVSPALADLEGHAAWAVASAATMSLVVFLAEPELSRDEHANDLLRGRRIERSGLQLPDRFQGQAEQARHLGLSHPH